MARPRSDGGAADVLEEPTARSAHCGRTRRFNETGHSQEWSTPAYRGDHCTGHGAAGLGALTASARQPGLFTRAGHGDLYCARGQAENLIKAHKLHLASDRTSCTKAKANQFRLLIHTAASWLLHSPRGLAPTTSFWRDAQFDTLRLAFVKISARVTERVTRIKVSLPSSYPYKPSLAHLARRALAMPP